jgi:trans-aconitate 2-methyltransferase
MPITACFHERQGERLTTSDEKQWDPDQYERFKAERARPFWDLAALVQPCPGGRVVDLGCGTGELTRTMHQELAAKDTLGIDSSQAMLEKSAAFAGDGLRFELGDIESFNPDPGSFDLLFSNAALHWAPHHARLFARLTDALAEHGQLAVQMPANHHHASHAIAEKIAREPHFAEKLGGYVRRSPVLAPEEYAQLLYEGVVEWVRGTTLTDYEKRLDPKTYVEFLAEYRARLLGVLSDERPYLFPFKRILLWARR